MAPDGYVGDTYNIEDWVGDTYNIEDLPSIKSLVRMAAIVSNKADRKTTTYWILKDIKTHDCFGIFEDFYPTSRGMNHSQQIVTAVIEQVGFHEWFWDAITQAEFETLRAFGIKEYKI